MNINDFTPEELDSFFVAALSGNLSKEEEAAFHIWLEEDPAHEAEFHQVKSFWNAHVSPVRCPADPTKELAKLMNRINPPKRKTLFSNHKMVWTALSVAASMTIGLFLGWTIAHSNTVENERFSFITADNIASFELPDGSEIHLNKNSRLEYDSHFGDKERRVHLEGEGYFDVERMEDCKFIVDLDGADVIVKGTVFNAFNHKNNGVKGAALVSGSICFETDSQHLQLTPSRQVIYDMESNDLTISPFDPSLVTAWKDNLFRYKSLHMNDLLDKISEEYQIDIVLETDHFGEEQYSGALDLGLPAANVLDIVAFQAGFNWYKQGGIYYITKP